MPRSFLVKKKEKGAEKSSCEFLQEDMTQQEAFDLSVNNKSKDLYDFDVKDTGLGSTNFGSISNLSRRVIQETLPPDVTQYKFAGARGSYDGGIGSMESIYGNAALNLVKGRNRNNSFQKLDHPVTHSVTPFTIEVLAISSRAEEKVKIIPDVGKNRVTKFHDLTDESTMTGVNLPSPLTSSDRVSDRPHISAEVGTVSYTYDAFFVTDGRSKKRKEPGITQKPRSQYRCNQCGKQYATSSNLSRHKQTHRSLDSQQAKKCHHCDKVYVSMPALSMHILTHELRHQCTVCNKSFSRPWLLQGHMRSHTGEKPYGCAHCGKAFADRSNLRAHMQTHSGSKQFECKRCSKTFALKSYLNKHFESACMKEQISGQLEIA